MQGYEDCNDATYLRTDPTFKAILNRTNSDEDLASQPMLCRLENRVTRQDIKKMITFQIDRWLDLYKTIPNKIVLAIDSTDDPTHGAQQMTLFHGYYGQYMALLRNTQSAQFLPNLHSSAMLRCAINCTSWAFLNCFDFGNSSFRDSPILGVWPQLWF